jgi:hypothetical protein
VSKQWKEFGAWSLEMMELYRDRTINSIVLLSNAVSFAIQIFVFLFLGSFAGEFENLKMRSHF